MTSPMLQTGISKMQVNSNLIGSKDIGSALKSCIDSLPQKDFAVTFAVESKVIQMNLMESEQKTRAVTHWNYDSLLKLAGVCLSLQHPKKRP